MPRCNKKATKIAFNILGIPSNIRKSNYTKVKDYSKSRSTNVSTECIRVGRK